MYEKLGMNGEAFYKAQVSNIKENHDKFLSPNTLLPSQNFKQKPLENQADDLQLT